MDLTGEFFLYRKIFPRDPAFEEFRGLEANFFSIDTFDIRIRRFSPEFLDKRVPTMNFFCIDPVEEI